MGCLLWISTLNSRSASVTALMCVISCYVRLCYNSTWPYNDDVVPWIHFQHYMPFVWGIHWSLVDSPHKGPVMWSFVNSLLSAWKNLFNLHCGSIFHVTGPLWEECTSPQWMPPHKEQWHIALMFSLICAWTNGWANNRDASYLRCPHAHYDITVMWNADSWLLPGCIRPTL